MNIIQVWPQIYEEYPIIPYYFSEKNKNSIKLFAIYYLLFTIFSYLCAIVIHVNNLKPVLPYVGSISCRPQTVPTV